MNDLIFTQEYYPELESLSEAQLAQARAFVVSTLRNQFPDVDLAAGTAAGDLIVDPMTAMIAATNEAYRRLMSDLDLSNVAAGIIYSCNFVERYLGNFGVYDAENSKTVGIVRLSFSDPGSRQINRAVRFRFDTDEFSLLFHADYTGDTFTILPPGSADAVNSAVLIQTSTATWAVDIPLTGAMQKPVLRGAQGLINTDIPGLIGIQAATNFIPSADTKSLPELARRARLLATSLSVNSKTGTMAIARKNWPNIRHICPIITGDPELLRTFHQSPGAFQPPATDVYVRSARDMVLESQLVYVTRVGSSNIMRGEFVPLHRPSAIYAMEWSADAIPVENWTLYTKSADPSSLGQTYCGSLLEKFYFEIELPLGDLDVPAVLLNTDGTAPIEVTYYADPVLRPLALTLEASENRQPGLSVMVKAGPLAHATTLTITYRRQPGVRMLLADARQKISEYVNACGWPELYNELKVHGIMRNAGALDVLGISYAGTISLTPATRQLHPLYTVDLTASDSWEGEEFSHPVPTLDLSLYGMRPDVIVQDTVDGDFPQLLLYAATERIIRPFVREEDIQFAEVL